MPFGLSEGLLVYHKHGLGRLVEGTPGRGLDAGWNSCQQGGGQRFDHCIGYVKLSQNCPPEQYLLDELGGWVFWSVDGQNHFVKIMWDILGQR